MKGVLYGILYYGSATLVAGCCAAMVYAWPDHDLLVLLIPIIFGAFVGGYCVASED